MLYKLLARDYIRKYWKFMDCVNVSCNVPRHR